MPPSHEMGHRPGAQPVALSSCVHVQQQTPMQYHPTQSMPPSHGVGRGQGAQPVALSSCVHVQQQTPMQYRPTQSMPPSHGVGRGQGAQPVAVVPTDAMRNLSIGTSTPVASVPEAVSLPLVASSSKLINPPARPGFGTIGRKVMITANHILVQLGDKNPHQYDWLERFIE
nr:argonaute/Dicer protein, PAZ [Tanacetum cinerariifolium]